MYETQRKKIFKIIAIVAFICIVMVIVGIVVNSKASDADMPIAVFDETLDNSDSKVNKKDNKNKEQDNVQTKQDSAQNEQVQGSQNSEVNKQNNVSSEQGNQLNEQSSGQGNVTDYKPIPTQQAQEQSLSVQPTSKTNKEELPYDQSKKYRYAKIQCSCILKVFCQPRNRRVRHEINN